jgi:thiol-disulfide isomerase/thioredoxin
MGSRAAFPGRGIQERTSRHANMSSLRDLLKYFSAVAVCAASACSAASMQRSVASTSATPESAIVRYLRDHIRPGEPVEVSKLAVEVFKTDAERKALNRLFNSFFKIPLFLVQAQKAGGLPPTLKEVAEQFAFESRETADVLFRVMEADPRVPRFTDRDPLTGEIVRVHVDRVMGSPRFRVALERTIAGWEGRPAPPFDVKAFDGTTVNNASVSGKPFVLYFWFTGCPPCLKTAPLLVELDRAYRAKGLTILGLNADRHLELDYDDAQRSAYAKKAGMTFTHAHANAESVAAYGSVSIFPMLFFVDRNGIIVRQIVNAPDRATLEAAATLALK